MKTKLGLGLADAFAGALAGSKKAELIAAGTKFKTPKRKVGINWQESISAPASQPG